MASRGRPAELAVGDYVAEREPKLLEGARPITMGTFTLDYRAIGKEGGDGSWTMVEGIESATARASSYALTGLDAPRSTRVARGPSSPRQGQRAASRLETAVGSTFSHVGRQQTDLGKRSNSAGSGGRRGDEVEFAVATNGRGRC